MIRPLVNSVRPSDAQRLFELSTDLFGILDAEGRFIAANPAWAGYTSLPVDLLPGQSFVDLLHEDDVEPARRALHSPSEQQLTNRLNRPGGGQAWVRWSIVHDADSARIYLVGRDVTPLVRSQEGLRLLLDELQSEEMTPDERANGVGDRLKGALARIRRAADPEPVPEDPRGR